MPPDPTGYLTGALDAAGTRPDLLHAVHDGLARLQAQARDELLLALVLEDDRAERLALVQADTRWQLHALVAHSELVGRLVDVKAEAEQPPRLR